MADGAWIESGEKFAIIGIDVPMSRDVIRTALPGGLTVLPDAEFALPDYWAEWLGTLQIEKLAECTLFLLASAPSRSPEVINGENYNLSRAVGDWFMGLVLVNKFSASDSAFLASGARIADTIDVRQFTPLTPPVRSVFGGGDRISFADLQRAAEIAKGIGSLGKETSWRLLSCLRIYQDSRAETNVPDRVHQFTRCIEGLIAPRQGSTRSDFKSRTELFIGPQHHDLIGEIYDIRSAVEHMQEHNFLKVYETAERIRIAKYEFVVEWIARTCLARILTTPDLVKHFGNIEMLEQFWAMEPAERRRIWGAPVDLSQAISNVDFDHVTDRQLGRFE